MIRTSAHIIEALPNIQFLVELENGKQIRAYLSGKMNMYRIKVLPGDDVVIELSPTIPVLNQVGRIILRK